MFSRSLVNSIFLSFFDNFLMFFFHLDTILNTHSAMYLHTKKIDEKDYIIVL